MKQKRDNNFSLIFHPFYHDWIRYPIRGVDRYNYELLRNMKRLQLDPVVLDSGFVRNHIEGIAFANNLQGEAMQARKALQRR